MQASHPPTPAPTPIPSKRIIVACDGTWLDSDNGLQHRQLQVPSNVTRICRAIKAESADQIPQTVYYHAGVGTEGSWLSRVAGGATAAGLAGNIREAYGFIALNYVPGDEIFLIGFSRGAFTARSIAGLIGCVGILTKAGLPDFPIIFKDFENRANPKYDSPYPDIPFPNKTSASNPIYRDELQRRKLTRPNIPIKAIAVWDTVGSLGIPRITWLEKLGIQRSSVKEYTFYDTSLSSCIEHAFHALALDERRGAFSPTIWEKPRNNQTNLRQVWFPGVHSNVGGGYDDADVANITLAWMIAQLEQFLDFDQSYLRAQYEQNRSYYQQSGQGIRPWSFGEIYNSLTGVYIIAGKAIRTPGNYMRVDSDTGLPTTKPLRDTNEYIHPSVRSRIILDGPGTVDRGDYECKAMAGYRLRLPKDAVAVGQPRAVWESRARKRGVPRRVLSESPLWETEKRLLSYSRTVYDYLLEEPWQPR